MWQHHLPFANLLRSAPTVHWGAATSCTIYCGLLPSFHVHNKYVKDVFISVSVLCVGEGTWVCVCLASLTRSMICLMVCRRMMPELFWSVPASLGSLSIGQQQTRVTESHQQRTNTTLHTVCSPFRHPCSVQLSTPINGALNTRL